MDKHKILVIEDDRAISGLLATMSEMNGYATHATFNGTGGIMAAMSYNPDVIMLDLGLPDMDGIEVIRKIRSWSDVPIIVISARSETQDKVDALDAGADDYLCKPFSVEELLARLRVAFRRVMPAAAPVEDYVFENGPLRIDYSSQIVSVNGNEIHLTPIEYRIVSLLSHNVDKVLTHNFILKEVWGSVNQSDLPSLRVFMTGLRKKLSTDDDKNPLIQTHIGVGYRMLKQ